PSASALEPEQPTSTNTLQPSVNPNGSVLGAPIGPNNAYTSIVLNGGTVSMAGTQSGEVACETDSPGVCYTFAWLKGETVTISVVPPVGSRLTSWGSSLCSPEQLTCTLSLVDTDGYTLTLQFETIPTAPVTPLPPSANTTTPPSAKVVISSSQPVPSTNATPNDQQTQTAGQLPVTNIAFNDVPYSNYNIPYIEDGTPVVVSGTTVPGAAVKVYTESSEKVTVVANGEGQWRFTVQDPEVGSHRVTAEVTDPATKVTSPPVELVSFKVLPAKVTQSNGSGSPTSGTSHWSPIFVAGTLAAGIFILLAALAWPLLRRNSRKTTLNSKLITPTPS
ncbi:MAG: hypothetical protein JNK33_03120, partial [Candidatus Doudnabacteria bacterium]|nr:hypothetical protein [Candidatus Doudnabacteria bacterium]